MTTSDAIMLMVFWGILFLICALRANAGIAFLIYAVISSACFAVGVKVILIHYT